jgi:hypothetical protein
MISPNCSTVCVLEMQKSRKQEIVKINYLKCIHKKTTMRGGCKLILPALLNTVAVFQLWRIHYKGTKGIQPPLMVALMANSLRGKAE